MATAIAVMTPVSSLFHSKSPPPLSPPALLSSTQLVQQLHLPKMTSFKWAPLQLTTGHSTLPATCLSTGCQKLSFPSSSITTDTDAVAMVCPSLAYANILYSKSGFLNVQINVADNEPEERILSLFKRAVIRAGILQECKRRRFFESTQDKQKRKTRDAARRNAKRRPRPRAPVKHEAPKKKDEDEDDNWELPQGEIPYC